MYLIHKRTSTRMDGTFDLIEVLAETFNDLTAATLRAMDLEAADRGKLHHGRSIQYDVVK